MTIPQLAPEQIAWLCNAVAQYIATQRARYAPRTRPLSAEQRTAMTGFFTAQVLDTLVVTLHDERVENPHFYPTLAALGFENLPDQSGMSAITFSDVIVSHEPLSNGLLFHELVHVEQYRQLGIERFAQFYVNGFLNGGSYERIPLEMHAYALGAEYEGNSQNFFSVQDVVHDYICRQAY